MKGLLYACTITLALGLIGCSEAQFQSLGSTAEKAEGVAEDSVPVEEVPEEELDEYVDRFECSQGQKRQCNRHDSEDQEEANQKKALVCHVPKGNPANRHEICISKNALKAHIGRHGSGADVDYFGSCDNLEDPPEDIPEDVPEEG